MRGPSIGGRLFFLFGQICVVLGLTVTVPARGSSGVVTLTDGLGAADINKWLGNVTFSTNSISTITLNVTSSYDPDKSVAGLATYGNINSGTPLNLVANPLQAPVYFQFSGAKSLGSVVQLGINPQASFGYSATGDSQLHLFAAKTGINAADTTGGTIYFGAVRVEDQVGGGLVYTINSLDPTVRYVFGFCSQANFAAGNNATSDVRAFSNRYYIPVAFNTPFNYAPNTQYQVGFNLFIAAQQASSFTVNVPTVFSSAANNTGPAQSLPYAYQINTYNNSTGSTVLKWVGLWNTFGGRNPASRVIWYKNSLANANSANWVVQNSANVVSNPNVIVTVQTFNFSQWTIGQPPAPPAAPATPGSASAITAAFLLLAAVLCVF